MKIFWTLPMVMIFLLMCTVGFSAEKTYSFDLITCDDETQNLEEPDGTINISVNVPEGADDKDVDDIYSKSVHPQLVKERNNLHETLIGIDKKLDNKNLTDDEVKGLVNEAHDSYHESVKSSTCCTQTGFEKKWSKTHRKSKTTKSTTKTEGGTVVKKETTTKSTRTSLGVSVDPVGGIMGLSKLFGSHKKRSTEPTYFPVLRSAIDTATKVQAATKKESKEYSSILKKINRYTAAKTEKDKDKARANMVKSLKKYPPKNKETRKLASELFNQIVDALQNGGKDDQNIGKALLQMKERASVLQQEAATAGELVLQIRGLMDNPSNLKEKAAKIANQLQDNRKIADELHNLAYEISRDIEY